MEEQISTFAVTHLLQCTLRSLCTHENSQWVYAVFWRILPRNYPPPKRDMIQGVCDRSRENRRNWILVWEDGFCNFAAAASDINAREGPSLFARGNYEYQHHKGLQPELFFKMSHDIYNYGEGLIGKVAAERSHKWIYREQNDQGSKFLSAWHNSAGSQPRTWEAQFQSGIETIALIALSQGVIQLGAVHKVIEDPSYVLLLRKKLSYIESIPGVLLPHPSSAAYPFKMDGHGAPELAWHYQSSLATPMEYIGHHIHQPMEVNPSMSSLEALLFKLPSVMPTPSQSMSAYYPEAQPQISPSNRAFELMAMEKVTKEEYDDEIRQDEDGGETNRMFMSSPYWDRQHFGYHHDLKASSMPNSRY